MLGFREIVVGAITSRLAELLDNKPACVTCVPSCAATCLQNPEKLLTISRLVLSKMTVGRSK